MDGQSSRSTLTLPPEILPIKKEACSLPVRNLRDTQASWYFDLNHCSFRNMFLGSGFFVSSYRPQFCFQLYRFFASKHIGRPYLVDRSGRISWRILWINQVAGNPSAFPRSTTACPEFHVPVTSGTRAGNAFTSQIFSSLATMVWDALVSSTTWRLLRLLLCKLLLARFAESIIFSKGKFKEAWLPKDQEQFRTTLAMVGTGTAALCASRTTRCRFFPQMGRMEVRAQLASARVARCGRPQ